MSQVRSLWLAIAATALLSAACTSAPAPTPPSQPASPTAAAASPTAAAGATRAAGVVATATTVPVAGGAGDTARGQTAFTNAGCSACHGDRAQGNVFPGAAKLSSTALTCDQVRTQIRTPKDPSKGMPPFTAGQVSDVAVNDICAWVKSIP